MEIVIYLLLGIGLSIVLLTKGITILTWQYWAIVLWLIALYLLLINS